MFRSILTSKHRETTIGNEGTGETGWGGTEVVYVIRLKVQIAL